MINSAPHPAIRRISARLSALAPHREPSPPSSRHPNVDLYRIFLDKGHSPWRIHAGKSFNHVIEHIVNPRCCELGDIDNVRFELIAVCGSEQNLRVVVDQGNTHVMHGAHGFPIGSLDLRLDRAFAENLGTAELHRHDHRELGNIANTLAQTIGLGTHEVRVLGDIVGRYLV
jgi:hypothetical protein